MSPFEQALGNAKLAIVSLLVALVASVVVNIILAISLANTPDHLTIWAKGFPSVGHQVVDPKKVSPARVLSLANFVWSDLNNWPANGATDIVDKIHKVAPFVTPGFFKQYQMIYKSLKQQGYVDHYIQVTTPEDGSFLNVKDIKPVADGWLVSLSMLSRFYYNPSAKTDDLSKLSTLDFRVEKTMQVNLIVKVVPYANRYGLAVAQIVTQPKIKVIDHA